MTPELWQVIERIFNQCLELPPAERKAFLEKECCGDPAVLRGVEELLEAATPSVLDEPFVPLPPELPNVGDRVDAYLLLEELGDGGFGKVYRALDENVRLEVALKVMRPDKFSPVTLRMFHEERRIQAQLHHNNIARLLSGGTTENGLPYFVMQYVEGCHLDTYCSEERLSVERRLELFHKVCLAVRYAHKNAVVHRDLKPRNVLVTESGEPMLLDFGIAKLLERRIGPAEPVSLADPMVSATIPLTVRYASPEQLKGKAVTTASDVYSLGVILYELLTDRSPYRLETYSLRDYDEAIRCQIPQKPSLVASLTPRSSLRPDETTRIFPRAGTPRQQPADEAPSGLCADLDCIVLKALQKNPDDRYDGAGSLAEDIRMYLDGLPVHAHPRTPAYLARKFLRRRKREVAAAIAMMFLIIFGIGMSVVSLRKHRAIESMQKIINMQNTIAGLEHAEEETLEQSLKEEVRKVGDDPGVAVLLNDHAGSLEAKGALEVAELLYREALGMKLRIFGETPTESVAIGYNNLAANLAYQGKYEEAEGLYRDSLTMRIRLHGRRDLRTAVALNNLGVLLQDTGSLEEAETNLRESLEIRLELADAESVAVGFAYNNMAFFHQKRGEYEMARAGYDKALKIFQNRYGSNHPYVAAVLRNQASLHLRLGDVNAAEALVRKALDILNMEYRHWQAADAESVLGECLLELGRHDDALALLETSARVLRTRKGPGARQTREAEDRLARADLGGPLITHTTP